MNRLEIPAKGIDICYPSCYEELTSKQAAKVGEYLYMAYTGSIDYDMARKLTVDVLINRVNNLNKPKISEECMDYWANEGVLAESMNFLFEIRTEKDGKSVFSINPKCCKQLIPMVKIQEHTYYGPDDLMANITIMEYKEASWRVGKYVETRDDCWLDQICGILYAKITNGTNCNELHEGSHPREDYSQERMMTGVKDFSSVAKGIKFMAFLFFSGCMNWIREEELEIDGHQIRFKCLFSGSADEGNKSFDDTGMAGVLFQMSESGVFGNMEQTSRVNVWDVFLRLYQIHMQTKSIKQ
jgi:hypothetical protein